MIRLTAYIGADDWYHETWEHDGKTYQTLVPPRLGGNNEDTQKEWDGKVSLWMARCMAHINTPDKLRTGHLAAMGEIAALKVIGELKSEIAQKNDDVIRMED